MKFGSLFSGIGGLDLGLERAGMEVVWQVENDPYCNRVLEKHWPDVNRYGDIKNVDPSGLEPVDLICGGFPCQPFSVAGKRKGTADDRWLWPEYLRIVRAVKPRWIVAENVPGLLSVDSGRVFAGILRGLAESGYNADWDLLPAAAFGAPHLRYRLFIVAHANSNGAMGKGRNGDYYHCERDSPSQVQERQDLQPRTYGASKALANHANGGNGYEGPIAEMAQGQDSEPAGVRGDVSDTDRDRCGHTPKRFQEMAIFSDPRTPRGTWAAEPDVGRVANGISRRVDRLRGLGNAVVPQVAQYIGERLLEAIR